MDSPSGDDGWKDLNFQVPGWDNEMAALMAYKEDIPLPSQTLLRNYHYCKNLVTRRPR